MQRNIVILVIPLVRLKQMGARGSKSTVNVLGIDAFKPFTHAFSNNSASSKMDTVLLGYDTIHATTQFHDYTDV